MIVTAEPSGSAVFLCDEKDRGTLPQSFFFVIRQFFSVSEPITQASRLNSAAYVCRLKFSPLHSIFRPYNAQSGILLNFKH